MWDMIVSVPDHCLSFYFRWSFGHIYGQILWQISVKRTCQETLHFVRFCVLIFIKYNIYKYK